MLWFLLGTAITVVGVLTWAHTHDPPIPDLRVDTVRVGGDYEAAFRQRDSMYAECHAALVRAQDRLRRLGHYWNGNRWVRIR